MLVDADVTRECLPDDHLEMGVAHGNLTCWLRCYFYMNVIDRKLTNGFHFVIKTTPCDTPNGLINSQSISAEIQPYLQHHDVMLGENARASPLK